jgi:hypothetical protein
MTASARWMSATYMGRAAVDDGLEAARAVRVSKPAVVRAWSTSRPTMVGAANSDSGPCGAQREQLGRIDAAGGKGTTWRAPAIRCGMA